MTTGETPATVDEQLLHRFRLLFEHTAEPMLITDGMGTVLDANRTLLDLVGTTLEDLRNDGIGSFLQGGEAENLAVRAERMARGSTTGETVLRLQGGRQLPIRYWTIQAQEPNGGLRAFIGVTPTTPAASAKQTFAALRATFDDSPDGKLVVDSDGNTIYTNRRHREIWGLTEDDLRRPFNERWAITRSRLRDPAAFKGMLNATTSDAASPHATSLELANGRIIEVRTASIPLDGASTPGTAFTERDVTDQANAQRQLRATATLLESVSTNSPEGIIVVDLDGKVIHHNQRFLDIWGVDESYFRLPIQERWKLLVSRAVDPGALSAVSRMLSEDMVLRFEHEFSLTNGKTIHMVARDLRDEGGELLGRASFYRDVTAERQAEAVLRESEERYRSLVSSLPVGVVMQYADGRIGTANAAAERILGLTQDQLLGLTSFDPRWHCIREDGSDFPAEEHPAVVTLRTGEPCTSEVMGVHHANGALRWLLVNSQPLFRGDTLDGVVVSFQDVTDQRHAEQALTTARTAEAFQALASGVAHKINNSLATIVGNAYLAGLAGDLPEATIDSLREITQAASDSSALVRDLLALSGRTHRTLRQLDVSEVVAGVLQDLSAEERGRTADDLAGDLPAIVGDPGSLAQAFVYVLRNALEAGDQVNVSTRRSNDFVPSAFAAYAPARPPSGRYLVIEVADDGPGVDPAVAARLFEPFASTKFAGRGLGLPASAGIMGTHHGFVEVTSSANGCRAALLLPCP